jgi:hypothetical protein
MRIALALVTLAAHTAPAFAQDSSAPQRPATAPAGASPAAQSPAAQPLPGGPPGATPPTEGQPPAGEPAVDPAYGERPDPTAPTPSGVDDRYVRGVRHGHEIVVRYTPDRSRNNLTFVAVTAGAGAVLGLVGAYFHFDSSSATDDVSADHFLGRPWTADNEDTYDRAHRSATIAGIMYGFGGALLLTSAITYIVTEPKLETRVIHPHTNAKPITMVAPVRGGAVVGTGWSF